MTKPFQISSRREFLQKFGGGAVAFTLSKATLSAGVKQLCGVFPVAFTPVTEDDKVDLDGLAAEVKFCNRGGVHGLVWPQLASGWDTLSEKDRQEGAEAIVAAGKGARTTLVIGVQGPDMAAVIRYAKHAEKIGADAIISLPPKNVSDERALLRYYQQVGRATRLPLFAQTSGTMSVDLLIEMFKTIPTFRHVKDEAGNPLERITKIRERTQDQLKVFSGLGVFTMITEMELGFAGHCPFTSLADVYASCYDLWHAGRKQQAFDMFGRILAFNSIVPMSNANILIARGVFKPGTKIRVGPGPHSGKSVGRSDVHAGSSLTEKEIAQHLKMYLGSYLKAQNKELFYEE